MAVVQWDRVKGDLRTYVRPFGLYTIRPFGRHGYRRVFLNNVPTQHYGTEKDCQHTVERIVNQLEIARG